MEINGKKTVLIVEDDPSLRSLAVLYISKEYSVLEAVNATEGLKLAAEEKPDALVLDMMIPGMSGSAFLQELQSREATRAIPVIIITAFNFTDAEIDSFKKEPNVRSLFKKPFNFGNLVKAVHQAAGESAPKP